MYILISFVMNLVAAFIWWLFFVLMGGRKKIDNLITIAIECARQFEHSIEYEDYDTACRQADRLVDLLINIEDSIKPLTYLMNKKKLIRTYMYGVYYVLTIFKNITVGYEGEQERKARCGKFKRKYLGKIEFDEDYFRPSIAFTLEVIRELNWRKSVKKTFKGDIGIYGYRECSLEKKIKIVTEDLVPTLSFKSEKLGVRDFIRESTFTHSGYKKYIARKMKSKKLSFS